MGLFFYTKKGSIISTVDLPTTEIIEPVKLVCLSCKVESEIDQQSSIFPYGENKGVNSGCQRVFI